MNEIVFIAFAGFMGLIVGSFLNVVIIRLPISLTQNWRRECYEYLELAIPASEQDKITSKINLLLPRSHCPKCKEQLRIIDNIPVLSYILLRGKCHFCKQVISIRYPIVELLTAIGCMLVAFKFGYSWQTATGCLLTCVLLVQAGIDLDYKIIPDEITMPMLWLGVILSLYPIFADSQSSIIGAVSGYLGLLGVYWLFYIATKKEGLGYGDFKLLGMLGAWLGWQMLPLIIILSSLVGSIVGIMFLLFHKSDLNTKIPFGPFLNLAGWVALVWGPEINQWYLEYSGIY